MSSCPLSMAMLNAVADALTQVCRGAYGARPRARDRGPPLGGGCWHRWPDAAAGQALRHAGLPQTSSDLRFKTLVKPFPGRPYCLHVLNNAHPMQGHAGTIPMPMRKDSMAAAAELVHWVERRCGGGAHSTEGDKHPAPEDHLVCTTGSISLWPGTFNVVPGSANFSLDIRWVSLSA